LDQAASVSLQVPLMKDIFCIIYFIL